MRVFVLLTLTALVFSVRAESIKIGYIDTAKVVNSLSQYQEENITIAQEFDLKKQELLDLFNHIEQVRSNLEEIDRISSKNAFEIELARILELESTFQKETEYWQEMINQKKVDLLQRIEVVVNVAIKEFAIRENYDLIFYENAAHVSEKANISNEIILIIEEMYTSNSSEIISGSRVDVGL